MAVLTEYKVLQYQVSQIARLQDVDPDFKPPEPIDGNEVRVEVEANLSWADKSTGALEGLFTVSLVAVDYLLFAEVSASARVEVPQQDEQEGLPTALRNEMMSAVYPYIRNTIRSAGSVADLTFSGLPLSAEASINDDQ